MTETAIRATNGTNMAALLERTVIQGDLSGLSAPERTSYYARVCDSLGLNPLTRPFDYIRLNNKLVLYARKDATDQLRSLHHISLQITSRETTDGIYVVTARATTPDGRTDEEIGAVAITGLNGEALANALMKASTKAKRRVTLSICGLGMLDETEVGSIPFGGGETPAVVVTNARTGEVLETKPDPLPAPTAASKDAKPKATVSPEYRKLVSEITARLTDPAHCDPPYQKGEVMDLIRKHVKSPEDLGGMQDLHTSVTSGTLDRQGIVDPFAETPGGDPTGE